MLPAHLSEEGTRLVFIGSSLHAATVPRSLRDHTPHRMQGVERSPACFHRRRALQLPLPCPMSGARWACRLDLLSAGVSSPAPSLPGRQKRPWFMRV